MILVRAFRTLHGTDRQLSENPCKHNDWVIHQTSSNYYGDKEDAKPAAKSDSIEEKDLKRRSKSLQCELI